jgi:DNA-binding response OmpR family regulator
MSLILIIEDEQDISEIIEYNLKKSGYSVITSRRGDSGLILVKEYNPDLIILDLMLPGMNGMDICKALRDNDAFAKTPILMLTSKSQEEDVIQGLNAGANDYISKPFNVKELLARVNANLRFSEKPNKDQEDELSIDTLVISPVSSRVTHNGQEIKLTLREFKILYVLAKHPGRVFSREQLLSYLPGDHSGIIDRNIDVHIRALRKKLSHPVSYIETVRGVGYRFKEV